MRSLLTISSAKTATPVDVGRWALIGVVVGGGGGVWSNAAAVKCGSAMVERVFFDVSTLVF